MKMPCRKTRNRCRITEDLVHGTFRTVHEEGNAFDAEHAFRAWLRGIAQNVQKRRRGNRREKMMKWACMVFCLAALSGAMSDDDSMREELRGLFVKHRRWLAIANEDWMQGKSSSAVRFDRFLSQLEAKSGTNTVENFVTAVWDAKYLAMHSHQCYQDAGFIQERFAVEMAIVLLKSSDRRTREHAERVLSEECYQEDLAHFSSQIQTNLHRPFSNEGWKLYGKLPLDESGRDAAFMNAKMPVLVRARMGDRDTQRSFVESFARATNYLEKANLADCLGYVGTRECAEALARGLQTNVVLEGEFDRTSARWSILMALGQIYQRNPLFTVDARAAGGGAKFDRFRGMDDYVKDVDAWIMREFGFHAWGKGRIWFKESKPYPPE